MVRLKVIAPFLLIVLVACNLADLTGVNITFTTTSDVPASTVTPVVVVITVTPIAAINTATPVIIATPTVVGQTIDPAVEAENLRTIATRRAAELLQYAKNIHDLLKEIREGQVEQPGPLNKLNDLNNELAGLWVKIAGYGLGADPYLDNIQISSTGLSRAELPSSYGILGPYSYWGLPRLQERFAELASQSGRAIPALAEFTKLVAAYSNPARYPHRDFYERAYTNYREGKELSSPQYTTDLETLDQWLSQLESVLEQIPAHFAE